MTYVDVVFGNNKIAISEDNANEFQQELDQVLVLMGLSDMSVSTEGNYSIKGQGEKQGWGIDFYHKENDLCMSVVMKIPVNEMFNMKHELKNKYPQNITNRIGGFIVSGSEKAMIELLQMIKYKI